MTQRIRETLMKKYKAWEYIAFFGGFALFMYAVAEIIRETYTDIWTPVGVSGLGILFMGFPKLTARIIKKKAGIKDDNKTD